ncbi:MAG TPA: hypothetical protein VFE47_14290 [Tepidisphaeraceae bacterium]|nr:hypothetical protein [Tepidisphaeraceae bacterium]
MIQLGHRCRKIRQGRLQFLPKLKLADILLRLVAVDRVRVTIADDLAILRYTLAKDLERLDIATTAGRYARRDQSVGQRRLKLAVGIMHPLVHRLKCFALVILDGPNAIGACGICRTQETDDRPQHCRVWSNRLHPKAIERLVLNLLIRDTFKREGGPKTTLLGFVISPTFQQRVLIVFERRDLFRSTADLVAVRLIDVIELRRPLKLLVILSDFNIDGFSVAFSVKRSPRFRRIKVAGSSTIKVVPPHWPASLSVHYFRSFASAFDAVIRQPNLITRLAKDFVDRSDVDFGIRELQQKALLPLRERAFCRMLGCAICQGTAAEEDN